MNPAYWQGEEAATHGLLLDANPYSDRTPEWYAWRHGEEAGLTLTHFTLWRLTNVS